MESSSSEETDEEGIEEDEEKRDEDSASESSSDEDEFDSADERANIVPRETPSDTLKPAAGEESSEESDSEDIEEEEEEEEDPMEHALKRGDSEKTEGIKHFDSEVESEYESESSSESEGLTQKPVVKGSSIEALPLSQKKGKKDDISVSQGIAEEDHVAKNGKSKSSKQQDPKPVKIIDEENPPAKKSQGAVKEILKDSERSHSVKDEKKRGDSAKKRKLELPQSNGETAPADSVPISKRRKDVDVAQNGKAGLDRDKLALPLSDAGKEVARKTLSDPSAEANGSKDVSNIKVSLAVDLVPTQGKKTNTDFKKGLLASPQKQKKSPHVWSTDEEIMMVSEVLDRVKMGLEVPSKRSDDFWLTLSELLHEKLGIEFSKDQLSEKLRRMKQRYQSVVEKLKESRELEKPIKLKKSNEQRLFDICSQIWGRAEGTSLDDHEAVEEPSNPLEVAASLVKEGKNTTKVTNIRPIFKGKASKEDVVATTDNNVVHRIVTMPMELDKAKEDHAKDILDSRPNEPAALSKDVHMLLQDEIHASLHELQEWSKNSMEVWMNKALTLIDSALKTLGDQARCMNAMGIGGGSLPLRLCDSMEFHFVHGEEALQQKWYELHLQEMNIYEKRLELMQKECLLKQEQLKLQLQIERRK